MREQGGPSFGERLLTLVQKCSQLREVIDFEAEALTRVFEEVVSRELIEVDKFDELVEIAKLAYLMNLPYKSFWAAITNLLLLQFQEMEQELLVQLTFYLLKQNKGDIPIEDLLSLDPAFMPDSISPQA